MFHDIADHRLNIAEPLQECTRPSAATTPEVLADVLTLVGTAQLVQQILREAFPVTMFSISVSESGRRTQLAVRWTDGPRDLQVARFVMPLQATRLSDGGRVERVEHAHWAAGGQPRGRPHRLMSRIQRRRGRAGARAPCVTLRGLPCAGHLRCHDGGRLSGGPPSGARDPGRASRGRASIGIDLVDRRRRNARRLDRRARIPTFDDRCAPPCPAAAGAHPLRRGGSEWQFLPPPTAQEAL